MALPDTGPRLLVFSSEHGPGAVDSVGTVLLLFGFGLIIREIYRRRAVILERLLARPVQFALRTFLAGLGIGLLMAGVFTDVWWWWLVGSLALQAFWLSLL